MLTAPILPGQRPDGHPVALGVLGGGQLGRMFVHAAQRMGYATAVLDPDPASPAGLVSHWHVQADYQDRGAQAQLLQHCAAITTEFESVPASAMDALAARVPVAPSAAALSIAQDRIREKAHFRACGVPTAPYAAITSTADLAAVADHLLPGILKTARLGYDGKGQRSSARSRRRAPARGAPACIRSALPRTASASPSKSTTRRWSRPPCAMRSSVRAPRSWRGGSSCRTVVRRGVPPTKPGYNR